jgi:hypothetical protein
MKIRMSHCEQQRIDLGDRRRLSERFFGAARNVLARLPGRL